MADIPLTNVSGFGGATKFIYNQFTAAGWAADNSITPVVGARQALSGALTANTLVDLINESGSAGQIDQISVFTVDTTSRTIRIVITVDGAVILDATSSTITSANTGGWWAGVRGTSLGSSIQLPPIKYTNSIRVQYASSLTETDKIRTNLAYQRVT